MLFYGLYQAISFPLAKVGIGDIAAIIELIREIIQAFKKNEVKNLGVKLKNAKSPEEKQHVAQAISLHLYNG